MIVGVGVRAVSVTGWAALPTPSINNFRVASSCERSVIFRSALSEMIFSTVPVRSAPTMITPKALGTFHG